MYIIYRIICKNNGKQYIGITNRGIEDRRLEHFKNLNGNKHVNNEMQNDFNKYGKESFSIDIIEETKDFNREIYWIDKKNSIIPNGYNIRNGRKWNEIEKEERSKKYTGQGNPNFGKKSSARKLNEEQCFEIKNKIISFRENKTPYRKIEEILSNDYNVSYRQIRNIIEGNHWSSKILGGKFKEWEL